MHAILSKSGHMAALFMEYSVALRAVDIQWGWTALHCAAHVGMDNVTKSLLGKRASPYAKSKVSPKTTRTRHPLSTGWYTVTRVWDYGRTPRFIECASYCQLRATGVLSTRQEGRIFSVHTTDSYVNVLWYMFFRV